MATVEQLIELYSRTDERLRALIQSLEDGSIGQRRKEILLRQVEAILAELTGEASTQMATLLGESYRGGTVAAVESIVSAGVAANTVDQTLKPIIHQRAVQAIMDEAFYSILEASDNMSADTKKRIEQVVRTANERSLTEGMSRKQATKEAIADLNNKGITGMVAKNGAQIPADKYMNGVVHYHQRKAHVTGAEEMIKQNDLDLVYVNFVGITCEYCAVYQGRVYSISGNDKRFPKLGIRPPYHSHCVHSISAWIEEYTPTDEVERMIEQSNRPFTDNRTEANIKRYKEIQAKKAQLNADRKQWEQYRLAAPDATPKTFSSFRRMKYNDSNKWEELKTAKQSHLNKQDYSDRMFGKFGNREVRNWYVTKDRGIGAQIDSSLPIRDQAIQAHGLRNKYRTEARMMMKDRDAAAELESGQPNPSFDSLVQHKINKYGMSEQEAYVDIVRSSQTPNIDVNKKYDIE